MTGKKESREKIQNGSGKRKMSINLPYLTTPGTITSCLNRIKEAATPERVNGDFVNNTLGIKGGAGAAVVPLLKKIGLVSSEGTPTELYRKYRNQTTGGQAIAEAIKIGYKLLLEKNERFYELGTSGLKDAVASVTGLDNDDTTFKLIIATLKKLMEFATFDQVGGAMEDQVDSDASTLAIDDTHEESSRPIENSGLNLSYTINLNLPATTDQAVFNAIFKALKNHLLSNGK